MSTSAMTPISDASEFDNKSRLLEKINTRQARVAVIGLGYVGLPLAIAFAEAEFCVTGFDTNASTVQKLQQGESHIGDITNERVAAVCRSEKFHVSGDFTKLKNCDAIIICVPTPLTPTRDPDLGAVKAAVETIRATLQRGQLVVLESTTYPGTTDEVVRPILEASGLCAGQDFFLAFSPERIDPGNEKFPLPKVPKVVGGHTSDCLRIACALYDNIVSQTVPVSSTRAAELTKLLENIFRSVNIALVNEMAMLCDRMDIDIWEVIDAAATKPYGFTKFLPGPGLGGHCIPIDPFYLSWKARQFDFQTNFIELAGEVNSSMPRHVVEKVMRALNEKGCAVRGAKIGLLGMSYKPNVGDCRESPSIRVAQLLLELGAQLVYHDPYVAEVTISGYTLQSQEQDTFVPDADCIVLLTNHNDYSYAQIAQQANLIIDTRNAFKGISGPAKIVKL